MPTYVYRCNGCGAELELVQKISEKQAPLCENPACESEAEMETIIGKTSFVLKGTSWARDGYSGGKKR